MTMAAVASPSTTPMARWMGSISSTNWAKGSAEMPEAVVSSTTEKAPSWSPMTAAVMLASVIRPVPGFFPARGL